MALRYHNPSLHCSFFFKDFSHWNFHVHFRINSFSFSKNNSNTYELLVLMLKGFFLDPEINFGRTGIFPLLNLQFIYLFFYLEFHEDIAYLCHRFFKINYSLVCYCKVRFLKIYFCYCCYFTGKQYIFFTMFLSSNLLN